MAEDVKVPEGWGRVKLGEVIEIFDNQRIPLDSESRSTIKGYIPYCGATGIIDYINDYIFDGEYVLIAEDGGKFNRFEETAYIMKGKFWANNHVHIVRGKDGILDDRFLMYSVNYQDISYYILGSTREKLNQQLLKSVVIFLPPLPEQRKIAEILETVDNAIEKTERIIEKYKRIKQGLMQELLTKGIDENGQIRNEETHRFKDSPLDRIPEEWEVVRLEEILQKTNNAVKIGPFGSQLKKDEMVEEGYKVYGQENVFNKDFNLGNRFINKEKYKKLISCVLKPGDFVISMMGTIGKCAIVPDSIQEGVMDSHLIRLKINDQVFCKKLLVYLIEESIYIQKQIINLSVGGIMQGLNSSIVKSLLIPLLSLPEQQRIASILSQIDKAIEREQKYKEKLEKIKRGLMEDLLAGKVRVNKLLKKQV